MENTPVPIDLATWPRREHFVYYREQVPCSWSMTVEVDVTAFVEVLRASGRKTYIAQLWALASIVNRHDEFRMALTPDGDPATWPALHPSFTVFNPGLEIFAVLWAAYDPDFGAFHDAVAALLQEHRTANSLFPRGEPPADVFDVSSLPRTSFSALHIQTRGGVDHLLPIFTLGRYVERDDRTFLPLALQVNHAAIDGFHASRFVSEFEALLADPGWL
ncbi:chloramphenicol acetyltransferase CAT [Subtercola boreus]|uniref:Chloramphenicol acetyltransferase CAT n=1 Tax=Subtercola boreus TaxID=120213 RepID=A0A3E0VHD5_9MICO|nr:CatA-like O-acetyltransferase [Subtercola boreus]RFA09055.1 chloramphenicol acetyltransferase CAT [Subtercola boreus]TQL53945.1 chloramphenicol O-acetyltransferase type A [Subtercola boreus]